MAKTYNLFISHSWDYVDDLMNLRELLESRGYFKVEFFEVPPHDPIESSNSDYVKSRIRQKIAQSDVVIGIAGMYATYSEWMEWELNAAKNMGKPILGVIPRGQQRVSQTVKSVSDKIVHWNTESIVAAIRELS
ncbi:MAG: TIR domain-containing protein [Bacteroidales bacterium]|nr:TIR domain-containing protein [Bacteroidales bacterium]